MLSLDGTVMEEIVRIFVRATEAVPKAKVLSIVVKEVAVVDIMMIRAVEQEKGSEGIHSTAEKVG
tara:strand:- start:1078 stop:1272 length:195 start_codon:yes stop_codon:yes gene_type:complete